MLEIISLYSVFVWALFDNRRAPPPWLTPFSFVFLFPQLFVCCHSLSSFFGFYLFLFLTLSLSSIALMFFPCFYLSLSCLLLSYLLSIPPPPPPPPSLTQVILYSEDVSFVSECVLILLSLLYPLQYLFPCIPLLPTSMPTAENVSGIYRYMVS